MRKQTNGGRKIKIAAIAMSAVILAAAISITTHAAAQAEDATTNFATDAVSHKQMSVPKLQQVQTIDLSYINPDVTVRKLSFSPDGRYLAIALRLEVFGAMHPIEIVVWDMEKGKPQSYVRQSDTYSSSDDCSRYYWSRDGKVIFDGAKRRWDAMSGEALPGDPIGTFERAARLNKDGSKMLTIHNGYASGPSYIHIYDTSTWKAQKLDVDGLDVGTAVWTAEGNILVSALVNSYATRETLGKTFDGYTIAHAEDVAIRLLDPSGREAARAIWFPAVPYKAPNHMQSWQQSADVRLSMTNFNSNMVTLGDGQLINGKTLAITTYYSKEDIANKKIAMGTGGMAFDPSGKFLFLKGIVWYDTDNPATNAIIDTGTGKVLTYFSGGNFGIAVRPDGKQLAIGDTARVQILSIEYHQ